MRTEFSGNYNHGAFQSGDKGPLKQDALRRFLEEQPNDFFVHMAESIAFDRGQRYDRDQTSKVAPAFEEWMSAKLIKNRGQFAAFRNSRSRLSYIVK